MTEYNQDIKLYINEDEGSRRLKPSDDDLRIIERIKAYLESLGINPTDSAALRLALREWDSNHD